MGKRILDKSLRAQRLEQRHRVLGVKVAELDARNHLTPAERLELGRLKKEKLAAKDALVGLRRS